MKDWIGNSISGHISNGISQNKNNKRAEHDFYATDPHSVDLFLKRIKKDNLILPKTIHEPACGQGHISEELKKHGYNVISSDLYDHGYGKSGIDFLKSHKKADCFITNPPYRFALEFVKKIQEHSMVMPIPVSAVDYIYREATDRSKFLDERNEIMKQVVEQGYMAVVKKRLGMVILKRKIKDRIAKYIRPIRKWIKRK